MKRRVIIMATALMCAGTMSAKGLLYKSASIGWGHCNTPSYLSADYNLGVNVGDYLAMGGGIAAEYSCRNDFVSLPLFINAQGFLMGKPSTAFIEFRMGYDFIQSGLYLQPSVGYRFPIKLFKIIKAIKPGVAYSWVNESHDAVHLKIGVEF